MQVQATEPGPGGGAAECSLGCGPLIGPPRSSVSAAWGPDLGASCGAGWTSPLLPPQLGLLRKVPLWDDSQSFPVGHTQPGSPDLTAGRCECGRGRGDSGGARGTEWCSQGLIQAPLTGDRSLQPTVHDTGACLLPRTPSSPRCLILSSGRPGSLPSLTRAVGASVPPLSARGSHEGHCAPNRAGISQEGRDARSVLLSAESPGCPTAPACGQHAVTFVWE